MLLVIHLLLNSYIGRIVQLQVLCERALGENGSFGLVGIGSGKKTIVKMQAKVLF